MNIGNLSETFYKELIENIDIGVYFVNKERVITFFNKAAERITGYKYEEVIGKSCKDNLFNHIDEEGNLMCIGACPLSATIADGNSREADVFLHHKKGHRVPIRVRASQIKDEEGNVVGAVETFYNTFNQKKIEEENEDLRVRAMTDELTDLPNRRYLEEWLIAKHREFKKFGRKYGVLMIDIDNFKVVNDTYGHLAGDDMLKIVSETLKSSIRANDIAARFGGEEFTMVISGITKEKLHEIARRVCALIYNSSLEVGNEDVSVSVSIGGSVVGNDDTIRTLFNRADKYLYKAKEDGKSRVYTDCGMNFFGEVKNKKF